MHSPFRFMQNDLVLWVQLEACRICFVLSCKRQLCGQEAPGSQQGYTANEQLIAQCSNGRHAPVCTWGRTEKHHWLVQTRATHPVL